MERNETEQLSPELRALVDESGLMLQELIAQLEIRAGTEHTLERLQRLPPAQQKTVLLRYGFLTGEPLTEEEVAAQLGLTERRVRQILYRFRRSRHCRFTRLNRFLTD